MSIRISKAAEAGPDDELRALATKVTNEIAWYLRERGLTQTDLAERMGVSPGRVSQIMGGGENLTLRTLAALSSALDARFDFQLTSLKTPDSYSGRGAAEAEAGNVHPMSRAQHLDTARDNGNPRPR
jgi:transcriptional regulator with XRE-family HTH domain